MVIDRDTGYDPRDIEPEREFQPPDVSSTTRRLATVDGRRIVAIVVRFYERSATGESTSASTPQADGVSSTGC